MPVLPEGEWERLWGLASGEVRWEGVVKRRPGGEGGEKGGEKVRLGGGKISRPHVITGRFMRRLWGRILSLCPVMTRSVERAAGWEVKWGDVQKSRKVGLGLRREGKMFMFAGVDERGKRIPQM